MKILFAISTYEDIKSSAMGSERAMWGAARALTDRGHEVTLTNILHSAPDWDQGYDVVHLWNASGQKGSYLLIMQMARLLYKPAFLTPIFWPIDEIKAQMVQILDLKGKETEIQEDNFSTYLAGLRLMFAEAEWLLPNAKIELEKVGEHLGDLQCQNGPIEQRYTVVPNGVNVENEILPALADDSLFPKLIEEKLGERFVLCVGRIEVRKNQHRLLQAMEEIWEEDPDLQLVLVGAMETKYLSTFQDNLKGKNVLICPEGPPEAILKLMKRCKIHILVSLLETPGLVSLEAAAMGRNIVVADRGSVREYFGDEAFYCDPLDPGSIATAIKAAIDSPELPVLAERVRRDYSYRRIAESLEQVYETALGAGRW